MQQLYKSASVYKQVEIEVVLQQDIGLVDRIRSQSETEEDKKLFLSYINQMVKFLPDCEDATAELLSSADAILMGCKGLHKGTREDGDIGKIFVPMTDYGTGHLRSRDEVMQILAHEAAHAQMTKYGKRKLRDHSQRHEMLTYRNLAILRGLEVELVEGPDGELQDFKVVQKDAPTPPPVVPVGPEAPGEAATAPGDSAGVTAPPEPPAKVDAAGEDSPIAIAREALRTAQEARELGQQMHARVERFMESGAWPSSEQTPAQETVSAELKRWHRAIDIYDIGRDPFGNLRIQKDYFLKEIEKLLEATEQGSEDEFSQEFMTSLRALRHFIRTTKETMFGGYTKCDPKEVLQRFERLIELLGPQAQAEAA